MRVFLGCLLAAIPSFTFSQVTPAGIANDGSLLLWLSSSDMQRYAYFSNEEVYVWPDLSGNGSDASTNITSNWPDLIENYLNGFPALSFETTGVAEHLDGLLAQQPDAPLTLITVGRFAPALTSATTQIGLGGNSGGAPGEATISRQNSPALNYYSFNGAVRSTGPVVNDDVHVWMAMHNSTAPFHSFYLDNTQETIPVDYSAALNAVNTNFSIGRNSSGLAASYLDGELLEVIVIDRTLNSAERNILTNYLSAKYDLIIASDYYSYDSPGLGDYDYEVGGIGMDNDGSWSSGNTSGLSFAPASGFENGDYAMAGHRSFQNSINTFDIREDGNLLTGRWSKTWAIDVTDQGTPLTADVFFDFSGAGLGSTPLSSASYRLIRENAMGGWQIIATASGIVNSDQVQFLNVPLMDGIYTLATTDLVAGPLAAADVSAGTGPGGFGRTDGSDALELWLDASQLGLANGASVATWSDLSGNGNNASQPSALNQPTFQINQFNALPAVTFNQADPEFMSGSLGNLDAPATIMAVAYFNQASQAAADSDYIIGIGEPPLNSTLPGVRASISRRWPDNGITRANRYYSYDGEYEYYGPVVSGQSLHIMSSVFQSSFPYHQVAVDGTFSRTATGPVAMNTNGDYDLGRLISQNQFDLDGRIAEVIVYRTALNTTQMRILQSALAAKWGIIIQNDLYSGDDPSNGDFDFGVTGIGRTIDGDVGTAQSGGLTVSMGNATSNDSFLTFGNAGISSTTQSTDIASNSVAITSRLTTVWYMSLTGSLGNTTSFTLDFGDMGIAGEPSLAANQYGMLYRAGTTGNWTVLASAQSINGDRLTFANIMLPGNGYITFGSLSQLLPIELSLFDATVVDEDNRVMVALNWETRTEIDNDYFTIERSEDGYSWAEIAMVLGSGTTKGLRQYAAIDRRPLRGTSYYRLAQTDLDGTRTYVGNLVRVEIAERVNPWKFVPHPASKELRLIFEAAPEAGTRFEIFDIMGRQLLQGFLVERESQIALDLRDGIYWIRVSSAGQVQSQRLIIRSGND